MVSCVCVMGATENNVEAATLSGQSAREITSQMTIGWNLGNSLDATSNLAVTGLNFTVRKTAQVLKHGKTLLFPAGKTMLMKITSL